MDGHFVPNLTMGPFIVEACRRATRLPLDVHLMIEEPERYMDAFAEAGASHITIHVETCTNPTDVIRQNQGAGMQGRHHPEPCHTRFKHRTLPVPGRPGAGHDRQPGVWRAGIHAGSAAEDRRVAGERWTESTRLRGWRWMAASLQRRCPGSEKPARTPLWLAISCSNIRRESQRESAPCERARRCD